MNAHGVEALSELTEPFWNIPAIASGGAGATLVLLIAGAVVREWLKSQVKAAADRSVAEHQSELDQQFHQRKRLLDDQYYALKKILSLSYRLKFKLRAVSVGHGLGPDVERLVSELAESMFDGRAILPERAFEDIHRLKSEVLGFTDYVRNIALAEENIQDAHHRIELSKKADAIDTAFDRVLAHVHERLGVNDGE